MTHCLSFSIFYITNKINTMIIFAAMGIVHPEYDLFSNKVGVTFVMICNLETIITNISLIRN